MAGSEPLLTIAIPTFNYGRFIPDAIASIIRQGLDDFEILIVDNASEDNTGEVVRSFENPRIRCIRQAVAAILQPAQSRYSLSSE